MVSHDFPVSYLPNPHVQQANIVFCTLNQHTDHQQQHKHLKYQDETHCIKYIKTSFQKPEK